MRWLRNNLLTLNVDKTKYVMFSQRAINFPLPEKYIRIHSCEFLNECDCPGLTRTQSIKYLGLTIDSSLNWSSHINSQANRIRKLIPVFKKLRGSADRDTLFCVYYSLVQSLLQYCVVCWGGIGITKLLPLERAQRAILKVMTGKPRRYSTDVLYKECPVLSVRRLFVLYSILRKHKNTPFIAGSKRCNRKVCPSIAHRTTLSRQQYFVCSGHFYNVANMVLNIYPLSLHECRQRVKKWLLALNYSETEKLVQY